MRRCGRSIGVLEFLGDIVFRFSVMTRIIVFLQDWSVILQTCLIVMTHVL